MVDYIGVEFYLVICIYDVLFENIEDVFWIIEFLFVNFYGVGKYCLLCLVNQYVKVVLIGEGLDEVFLGYVYF